MGGLLCTETMHLSRGNRSTRLEKRVGEPQSKCDRDLGRCCKDSVPHIFLNDQNGDVTMATVSGISSSTYFTLKVRYDTTQSQYNVYVNNALQGSYTVIRETQKYTRLNQLLIMSPDVNQKHRNVKLYEGIV